MWHEFSSSCPRRAGPNGRRPDLRQASPLPPSPRDAALQHRVWAGNVRARSMERNLVDRLRLKALESSGRFRSVPLRSVRQGLAAAAGALKRVRRAGPRRPYLDLDSWPPAGLPPEKWSSLRYGSRELKEDVSDVKEEAQA